MANLLFKRGSHAGLMNLKAEGKITDGAFYLTQDSHRLYAGIGSDLVDLNKYILVFDTLNELKEAQTAVEPGDFAYIKDSNILAIYRDDDDKSGWVQINAVEDNPVDGFDVDVVDANTLEFTVINEDDSAFSDRVKFLGTDGVDVTVSLVDGVDKDNKPIKIPQVSIDGNVYTMGGKLTPAGETNPEASFEIKLSSDKSVGGGDVKLTAGENIAFSGTNSNLVIGAKDTTLVDNSTETGVTTTHTFEVDGAVATVTITDTDGNVAVARSDKEFYYTIGNGDAKVTIDNQGELPVYTKSEIDSKIAGLNAMVYRGTLGAGGTVTELPTTGVQAGDTYLVKAANTYADVDARIGDLFIATGIEWKAGEDGATVDNIGTLKEVVWTYVPSGDDAIIDTQYYAVVDTHENKISLLDSNDEAVHILDLDGSEKIDLVSFPVTNDAGDTIGMKTEIQHKGPGTKDGSKESATIAPVGAIIDATNGGYKVTVMKDQEVDSTGHVITYNKANVNIPNALLGNEVTSKVADTATVTETLSDTDDNELSVVNFTLDATAVDNLKINVDSDSKTIQLSMVWDTFE